MERSSAFGQRTRAKTKRVGHPRDSDVALGYPPGDRRAAGFPATPPPKPVLRHLSTGATGPPVPASVPRATLKRAQEPGSAGRHTGSAALVGMSSNEWDRFRLGSRHSARSRHSPSALLSGQRRGPRPSRSVRLVPVDPAGLDAYRSEGVDMSLQLRTALDETGSVLHTAGGLTGDPSTDAQQLAIAALTLDPHDEDDELLVSPRAATRHLVADLINEPIIPIEESPVTGDSLVSLLTRVPAGAALGLVATTTARRGSFSLRVQLGW